MTAPIGKVKTFQFNNPTNSTPSTMITCSNSQTQISRAYLALLAAPRFTVPTPSNNTINGTAVTCILNNASSIQIQPNSSNRLSVSREGTKLAMFRAAVAVIPRESIMETFKKLCNTILAHTALAHINQNNNNNNQNDSQQKLQLQPQHDKHNKTINKITNRSNDNTNDNICYQKMYPCTCICNKGLEHIHVLYIILIQSSIATDMNNNDNNKDYIHSLYQLTNDFFKNIQLTNKYTLLNVTIKEITSSTGIFTLFDQELYHSIIMNTFSSLTSINKLSNENNMNEG